ncbi:MAG: LUD domain-containing protein [Bacteroidota bacterium]|jgi:L-lactate dehydrogenase complex protein LldG
MTTRARETILKKIRKALSTKLPVPYPEADVIVNHYAPEHEELELEFAENFSKLLGKFSYCIDANELCEQLKALVAVKKWTKIYCAEQKIKVLLEKAGLINLLTDDLNNCEVSITGCENLVARTGTIVLTSAQTDGRNASVYAPVHICIAYQKQLLYDLDKSLSSMQVKYKRNLPSLITFATGPSRTADIEKTLVVGVHGPKEVYCFLVDEFLSRP